MNFSYEKLLFDRYGVVLLNTMQVSEVVGRSIASLENDRKEGRGIPFMKVGDKKNSPCRYRLHDISNYINAEVK